MKPRTKCFLQHCIFHKTSWQQGHIRHNPGAATTTTTTTTNAQTQRYNSTSSTRIECSQASTPNTTTTTTTATQKKDARTTTSTSAPAPTSTSLSQHLIEIMKITGPIPIASYMRQCLTSSIGGYYTTVRSAAAVESNGHPSSLRDPFGRKGDFITSPEISQMFGEMLGVWIVTEWMAQGRKPSGIQIIELGPGRGTLMDDIFRTLRNFKRLQGAVEAVYLIEASSWLRQIQKNKLCGEEGQLEEIKHDTGARGWRCTSKYFKIPVLWYEDIRFLPKDVKKEKTPFFIAHEFFDALPMHAFQATNDGWRELLVSHTSLNLKPTPTIYTQPPIGTTLRAYRSNPDSQHKDEFHLTLSPGPTKHSLLLPELSERYKSLKSYLGSTIEISPEAMTIIEDISLRIGGSSNLPSKHQSSSGAALIIDYGPSSTIPVNSLRGIRSHKPSSPFSSPGNIDISVDVDFTALAERACIASPWVEVHGPVEQGSFLLRMGMKERLESLLRTGNDEEKKALKSGYERLVERGGGGMGRIYQVMAVVPERGGGRPVGFGGDAVSSAF